MRKEDLRQFLCHLKRWYYPCRIYMKLDKTYISDVNSPSINKTNIIGLAMNLLAVIVIGISPVKNQILQNILMFINAFCIGFFVGYYLLKRNK